MAEKLTQHEIDFTDNLKEMMSLYLAKDVSPQFIFGTFESLKYSLLENIKEEALNA